MEGECSIGETSLKVRERGGRAIIASEEWPVETQHCEINRADKIEI